MTFIYRHVSTIDTGPRCGQRAEEKHRRFQMQAPSSASLEDSMNQSDEGARNTVPPLLAGFDNVTETTRAEIRRIEHLLLEEKGLEPEVERDGVAEGSRQQYGKLFGSLVDALEGLLKDVPLGDEVARAVAYLRCFDYLATPQRRWRQLAPSEVVDAVVDDVPALDVDFPDVVRCLLNGYGRARH